MCRLKVRFSQSSERRGVFNYALKVEVTDATGIPSKIFVYHQSPAGMDGNTFAEFDHVATPVDFQEIPEDAASEIVPWYRTDKCTVWFRNVSDMVLAKQLFVDDINALQRTFGVLTSENGFRRQTSVEFSGNGVHEADIDDGDTVSQEIKAMKKDISGKVSKDAMLGVEVETNTPEGIRNAVQVIGNTLGAKIVKTVVLALSVLSIGASALGAGFSGVHSAQIDLDENPVLVTNVTFDGLATLVDITNVVDSISTNFVPALKKEIADASEAGTNYVDSATNLLSAAIDEKYDKQADGIPKGDLSAGVQASLDKADTAVQPAALSGYKPIQEPVGNPPVSTSSAYNFVNSITQDVNGVIYATRCRIPTTTIWNPLSGDGSATDALTQRGISNFRETVVCGEWYPGTNYLEGAFVLLRSESKCYVCTNAHVSASSWTAAESGNWSEATVADVLMALRTGKLDKIVDAKAGDIAAFDASGSLKLSGMIRDANGNLTATEFTYTQSQVADYDSAAVGTTINKANTPVVLHSGEYWLARKSFIKTDSGWSVDSVTGRLIKPGATGVGSTAWGEATAANGNGADSEGKNTRASGAGAHAEGQDTDAIATAAHAEGLATTASGSCSHSEGANTFAGGTYSHAEGSGTKTQNIAEHAQGQYNWSNHADNTFGSPGNTLMSVGIGTSDSFRTNAMEVMQDGKVYVKGIGGYVGRFPLNATDLATVVSGKANDDAVVKLMGNQDIEGNKTFQGEVNIDSAAGGIFKIDNSLDNASAEFQVVYVDSETGDILKVVIADGLGNTHTLTFPNTSGALALVSQLQEKANRAANPTAGNLAALDANGNPTDSGLSKDEVAEASKTVPTNRTVNGKALSSDVTIGDEDIPYTGYGSEYYPTVKAGLSVCSAIVASLPSPSDILYIDGAGNVAANSQGVSTLSIDFQPVAVLESQSFTDGNIVAFDSDGYLADSGIKPSDKLDTASTGLPEFDASASYEAGVFVVYGGRVYKCTAAHNGVWDAAHFAEVELLFNHAQHGPDTTPLAIGASSYAGTNATALGGKASAGQLGVAVGANDGSSATSAGVKGVAVGCGTTAGDRGISIGDKAKTTAVGAIAIGGTRSSADSSGAQATASGACQIGYSATPNATADSLRFRDTIVVDGQGKIPSASLEASLSGESMPANPTQNELAEAVKKIFTALGGTIAE